MLFFLVLGLLVGAIAVVFALQNTITISVMFLAWELQGSLSLILLVAVATGVLICILLSIPEVIKTHIEFSVLKKQVKKLEDDNASYKRLVGDVARVSDAKVIDSQSSSVF
jgi:uncharacterized integral membrane protein